MNDSKDKLIQKEMEFLVKEKYDTFTTKEITKLWKSKARVYKKTFKSLSKEIEKFTEDNLMTISDIRTNIEWHIDILKKQNEGNTQLHWAHTNKFIDNIKSTIEFSVFVGNDITIPNHYLVGLCEWHYFYENDYKEGDNEFYHLDIDIGACNIEYKNLGVPMMDLLSNIIFKYVHLGGKLEELEQPPTFM